MASRRGPALTAQLIAGRGFLPEYDEAWVEPRRAQLDLVYQRALACYAEACLYIGGRWPVHPRGQVVFMIK